MSADPYTLIYSWVVEGTPVKTLVKWVLEKTENGTKLTLEHSGTSNYGSENAIAMFGDFKDGWDNCHNGLTKRLIQEVPAK